MSNLHHKSFHRRLSYGQKFEKRLVDIFTNLGFEAGLFEFNSAAQNAQSGDLFVKTESGRTIRLEAKYTCKIAIKSIERFDGSFYILTPYSNSESPTKITSDKIFVIPRHSVVSYKNALVEDNKVFKLPSGDLGIELNLGQYKTGFEFQKKITLKHFIECGLIYSDGI